MDDQELAAIRAARLEQLKQNVPSGGGTPGSGDDAEAAAKRAAQEQMSHDMLAAVLDNAARERRT